MKAWGIMQNLFTLNKEQLKNTQDVLKAGDPNKEVKKIAVTMFPTVKVIREASAWGADLLVVHEPLYFNHCDEHSNESIECEKRDLVEKSGMTVYRYHDYSHRTIPDMICKGVLDQIGFDGEVEHCGFALSHVKLNEEMTAKEIARFLEKKLNLKNVRLCGNGDFKTRNISFMPGAGGWGELKELNDYVFIMGEICEWAYAEYIRDAADLGHKKALLILGHVGSEREGMRYTAKVLQEKFPETEVEYFETEEAYFPI